MTRFVSLIPQSQKLEDFVHTPATMFVLNLRYTCNQFPIYTSNIAGLRNSLSGFYQSYCIIELRHMNARHFVIIECRHLAKGFVLK